MCSNAKARKWWIIDRHFCSISNIEREKGDQKWLCTTQNFVTFQVLFFLQCDARPNHLNRLFLMSMNLWQQMSRSTVYCLSFMCFIHFEWDFRRKPYTHQLTYAQKKIWTDRKNESTVEIQLSRVEKTHQMCDQYCMNDHYLSDSMLQTHDLFTIDKKV